MLLSMKAHTEAARALAYSCGFAVDSPNMAMRRKNSQAAARVDLLTPIVKGWLTDLANEMTSTAVQVFGGMGYIEETGAAQHMRDARILAIYEGIEYDDKLPRKDRKNRLMPGARSPQPAITRHTLSRLTIAATIPAAGRIDVGRVVGGSPRSLDWRPGNVHARDYRDGCDQCDGQCADRVRDERKQRIPGKYLHVRFDLPPSRGCGDDKLASRFVAGGADV